MMNSRNDDPLAGALYELGDDEGRPMPLTPNERLGQYRTRRSRRRMALAGGAVVAAVALTVGGLGLSRLDLGGNSTISPASEGPRRTDPFVTAAELPSIPDRTWRETPDTLKTENECAAPLANRAGYRSRVLTTEENPADASTSTRTDSMVWQVVGAETTADAARQLYADQLARFRACMAEAVDDNGEGSSLRATSRTVAGADEGQIWRLRSNCPAEAASCDRVMASVALARVGNVLVATTASTGNAEKGFPSDAQADDLERRAVSYAAEALGTRS